MPKGLGHPPWTDRSGRFSLLKTVVFAGLFAPAIATFYMLMAGDYMAEPAKGVNHELGLWALRLLLLSLAITPAMQIFRLPRLILVRRMIGVAAFAYAFSHLCAYAAMENFHLGKVVSEIIARYYLAIGFAGLLLLGILTATSVDAAVRKMGTRAWARLHRTVYLVAVLAIVHYFIQSKLVVTEPTIFAGLLIWLMGYRLILWLTRPRTASRPLTLMLLALASAALTMIGEAVGYMVFTPIDAIKVFDANFTFVAGIRPGWIVLLVGVAIVGLALIRSWSAAAPARATATV
ncbi:MAG: ferric reductase-like transmembrane domain-containing protein [Alphaproteobacteria bacterium]|nr:ferric reductase-like transmembrane domain-containing protein [Alphaproteobacteria bacterium]